MESSMFLPVIVCVSGQIRRIGSIGLFWLILLLVLLGNCLLRFCWKQGASILLETGCFELVWKLGASILLETGCFNTVGNWLLQYGLKLVASIRLETGCFGIVWKLDAYVSFACVILKSSSRYVDIMKWTIKMKSCYASGCINRHILSFVFCYVLRGMIIMIIFIYCG